MNYKYLFQLVDYSTFQSITSELQINQALKDNHLFFTNN